MVAPFIKQLNFVFNTVCFFYAFALWNNLEEWVCSKKYNWFLIIALITPVIEKRVFTAILKEK